MPVAFAGLRPSDSGGQALEGPKLRIGTNGFLKRLLDQRKERRKEGRQRKTFSSNKGGGFTNTFSLLFIHERVASQTRIKPVSLELQGRFLTTGPPEKPFKKNFDPFGRNHITIEIPYINIILKCSKAVVTVV